MSASPKTFYDLSAPFKGKTVNFSDFKGKVVLIINVASKCGFTPQYTALEEIHKRYESQGLVVLGFPCNQFGGQEPGTDDQIVESCQLNHGVSFPLAKKSDVNGDDENEVFHFLKRAAPGILGLTRVKWNFEKFLVDRKGNVYSRYPSTTTPAGLEGDITKLLAQEP